MSDVYELMAGKGLCAHPVGQQSVRVIPEAERGTDAWADPQPAGEMRLHRTQRGRPAFAIPPTVPSSRSDVLRPGFGGLADAVPVL